jgi:peptidoglycan/LPS O-acetylase OafA/YrhL
MKERIPFVDWLRATACFMVMLVHASEHFYGVVTEKAIESIPGGAEKLAGFATNTGGLAGDKAVLLNEANRFWVAFYDGGVARTCVPLFMVVSAFLLVPIKADVSMTQFYKRRFKRILPPMIFFMLLYAILPVLWGEMTWDDTLRMLPALPFNFPENAGHLWFMYPLISLYLIIPVISPWLERASAKDECIFIGLFAFSTLIPWLHTFVTPELWGECFWNRYSMLWYCSGFLGYLVIAHYIRFHLNWTRGKRLKIGALCFLVGAVFTAWSFWWKGEPLHPIATPELEWSWEFCTPNVALATFGAFLLFSCIGVKADGTGRDDYRAPRLITEFAKLSFGMYLMHIFFLNRIAAIVVQDNPAIPAIPVWAAIPFMAIACYICCAATTKLISLLPGSKWIVG